MTQHDASLGLEKNHVALATTVHCTSNRCQAK